MGCRPPDRRTAARSPTHVPPDARPPHRPRPATPVVVLTAASVVVASPHLEDVRAAVAVGLVVSVAADEVVGLALVGIGESHELPSTS
jgi:hypothetical protein